MKTYFTLLKTEIKLSIRDMNMIIFAIILPLILLFIYGIINGNAPAYDGADYSYMTNQYSAILSVSIIAGGLMGLPLLISDYRAKKILKKMKVTPVRPSIILFASVGMYFLYAIASLALTTLFGFLFFNIEFKGNIILFIVTYIVTLLSIFSIGMVVGGLAKDMKQASIIASLLYFGMLLFSGTTIPYNSMPDIMKKVVDFIPLTQGIKLMQEAQLGLQINYLLLGVLGLIAVICTFISIKFFKWE